MNSPPLKPTISLPCEGELFELEPDSLVRFKVFARDTDGVIELYERELPAYTLGADPHIHETTTETFYVVGGEPTILCGDTYRRYGSGAIVVVPPNTVHAYRNDTGEHAKVLISFSPALGHEEFFRSLAELKHGVVAEYKAKLDALRIRFDSRSVDVPWPTASKRMMGTRPVTVELPRVIYWRLQCRAAESGRSLRDELVAALGADLSLDADPESVLASARAIRGPSQSPKTTQ